MDWTEKLVEPCVAALRENVPAGVLADRAYWPAMVLCAGDRAGSCAENICGTLKKRWTNGGRIACLSVSGKNICTDDWDRAVAENFEDLIRDGFPVYDHIIIAVVASADETDPAQIAQIGRWIREKKLGLQHILVPVLFLFRSGKHLEKELTEEFAAVFSMGDLFQSGQSIPRRDEGVVIADTIASVNTDLRDAKKQQQLISRFFSGTGKVFVMSHTRIEKPVRRIAVHVLLAILRNVDENGDGIEVDQTTLMGKISVGGALKPLRKYCDDVCAAVDGEGLRHAGLARIPSRNGDYVNERWLREVTLGGWEALYREQYSAKLNETEWKRLENEVRKVIKSVLDPSEIIKLNTADYMDVCQIPETYTENNREIRIDIEHGKWWLAAHEFTKAYFLRSLHSNFAERFRLLLLDMAAKAGDVSRWIGSLENELAREENVKNDPIENNIETYYKKKTDVCIKEFNERRKSRHHDVCGLDVDATEDDWTGYILESFRGVTNEEVFRKTFQDELSERLGTEFESVVGSALNGSVNDIRDSYNLLEAMENEVLFSGGNDRVACTVQSENVCVLESGGRNEVCLVKIYGVKPENLRWLQEDEG